MSSHFNGFGVKEWFDPADGLHHMLFLDVPGESPSEIEVSDADYGEARKKMQAALAPFAAGLGGPVVFEVAISVRD